jgi:hypothetical protein
MSPTVASAPARWSGASSSGCKRGARVLAAPLQQQRLGQQPARGVQIGPALEQPLERRFRESVVAARHERAREPALRRQVVLIELDRARVVAQRHLALAPAQQQRGVAGEHVDALVARGQRELELLLGARRVLLRQRDLRQRAVGAAQVRVERERGLEVALGRVQHAGVELEAGQRHEVGRALGIQLDRALHQLERLAQIAALAPDDAEQVQGLGVVGIEYQEFAITGLRFLQPSLLVQFYDFFEHLDPRLASVKRRIVPAN